MSKFEIKKGDTLKRSMETGGLYVIEILGDLVFVYDYIDISSIDFDLTYTNRIEIMHMSALLRMVRSGILDSPTPLY